MGLQRSEFVSFRVVSWFALCLAKKNATTKSHETPRGRGWLAGPWTTKIIDAGRMPALQCYEKNKTHFNQSPQLCKAASRRGRRRARSFEIAVDHVRPNPNSGSFAFTAPIADAAAHH